MFYDMSICYTAEIALGLIYIESPLLFGLTFEYITVSVISYITLRRPPTNT